MGRHTWNAAAPLIPHLQNTGGSSRGKHDDDKWFPGKPHCMPCWAVPVGTSFRLLYLLGSQFSPTSPCRGDCGWYELAASPVGRIMIS